MRRVAKVLISEAVYKELVNMPTIIVARMRGIFERLKTWPAVSGAKPLRHGLKGHYRVRTGKYRVVFRVEGDTVKVLRIDHREDVYED
jgi:mRNA-degrading endonuclease RelE of RelBE toxin-antitoxin system